MSVLILLDFVFSKQEEARAEYKRLKREMMETKRKKEGDSEKHSSRFGS